MKIRLIIGLFSLLTTMGIGGYAMAQQEATPPETPQALPAQQQADENALLPVAPAEEALTRQNAFQNGATSEALPEPGPWQMQNRYAEGNGYQHQYADADGDGVCDNFVDEDGDGICDHAGSGRMQGPPESAGFGNGPGTCTEFVDEDGDGVCDLAGSGAGGRERNNREPQGLQNGAGNGQGQGNRDFQDQRYSGNGNRGQGRNGNQ